MKQPRRLAAWMAAFLIAASLVAMPREGATGPPFVDNLPPPGGNEGDPDVPYGAAQGPAIRAPILTVGRISITFVPETRTFLIRPAFSRLASPSRRWGNHK